ncbi:Uncharacterised protein [Mycobacteroides abscessus subsp. abscessus]|nr:Uncharacterised protein [Mycobacteroides abscessus subsp. abscessus]
MLGLASPAMSTNALKVSGCITVKSSAQVPPIDHPATPHWLLSSPTRKFEVTYGTTSLTRWSAALPRRPFTHSVSLLNAPVASANTSTGAYPPCPAAKSSAACVAWPAHIQSAGVFSADPIINTAGSRGAGLRPNHAGGR